MARICMSVILSMLMATAGCEGVSGDAGEPTGELTISIDTIAGIEQVRSTGSPPAWTLDTILALGALGTPSGEPADDEFASVSSVTLGPEGNLYVADHGNNEIRVFDRAGVLTRTIGRQGEGPGEFSSIFSIQWMGETLMAMDRANARIGLISRAGEWLGSRPAVGRLVASPVTFRLYRVGAREVYQWAYRTRDGSGEATWRRHGPAGIRDEWPREPLPVTSSFPDKVVCTLDRGFSWFDHPYATRSLQHPAPGSRVYLATTNAYRIVLVDARGDTIRIIERSVEPPVLGDDEWAATATMFEEWIEDKDRSRCQPADLMRPDRKPILESLMVDIHGRLWVERNLEHGTRWEVFDRGGRLMASVGGFAHDRQRTVPWLSDDYVAWVSRGQSDIPRVHLARIVK